MSGRALALVVPGRPRRAERFQRDLVFCLRCVSQTFFLVARVFCGTVARNAFLHCACTRERGFGPRHETVGTLLSRIDLHSVRGSCFRPFSRSTRNVFGVFVCIGPLLGNASRTCSRSLRNCSKGRHGIDPGGVHRSRGGVTANCKRSEGGPC